MMDKNKLKWIFQVFLCIFAVIKVGKFEPSSHCQETNKKIPNVGASFIRDCLPNQYFDDDENRCELVPGGGRHLRTNKTQICDFEKYISDCENLSRYAVCRPTKTIYAECPCGWKFSIRLKRCVVNANPSKFCTFAHSSSTKKPTVTPYVIRRRTTPSVKVKVIETKSSAITDVSTLASIVTDDLMPSTPPSEAVTTKKFKGKSTADKQTTGDGETTATHPLSPKKWSTIKAERSTTVVEDTPSSDFSSTFMLDTTMPHDLTSLIKKTTLSVHSFSTQSNLAEKMTSGKGASITQGTNDPSLDYTTFFSTESTPAGFNDSSTISGFTNPAKNPPTSHSTLKSTIGTSEGNAMLSTSTIEVSREERTTQNELVTASLPSSEKNALTTEDKIIERSTIISEDTSSTVSAFSSDRRTSNHDLTSLITGSTLNSATTRSAATEDETSPDKSISEQSATTKRASEGSSVYYVTSESTSRPENSAESTIFETAATDADSKERHSSTAAKTSSSLPASTDGRAVQDEKSTTVMFTNSVGYSGNLIGHSSTRELETTEESSRLSESMTNPRETSTSSYANSISSSSAKRAVESSTAQESSTRGDKSADIFTTVAEKISTPTSTIRTTLAPSDQSTIQPGADMPTISNINSSTSSTLHEDFAYETSTLSTISHKIPVSFETISDASTEILKLSTLGSKTTTIEPTATADEEYKSSSIPLVTESSTNPQSSTGRKRKTTSEETTPISTTTEQISKPSSISSFLMSSTEEIVVSSEPSSVPTISEMSDLTTKQPSTSIDSEFTTTFKGMQSTVSHDSSSKIVTRPTSSSNSGPQVSIDRKPNVSESATSSTDSSKLFTTEKEIFNHSSTMIPDGSTMIRSSTMGELSDKNESEAPAVEIASKSSSVSTKYSEKISTEPYEGSTTVVNDLLGSKESNKASPTVETTSGTDLTAAFSELSTSKSATTGVNQSTDQSSTAKEAISEGSNYVSTSVVKKILTSTIPSTAFESIKNSTLSTLQDSPKTVSDSTTPLSIVSGGTETSLGYPSATEQSTVSNSESTRSNASTQKEVSSSPSSASVSAELDGVADSTATLPSSVKDAFTTEDKIIKRSTVISEDTSSTVAAFSSDRRTSNHDLTSLITGSTLNSATTRSAVTEDETSPDKSISEQSATTKRPSEGSSVYYVTAESTSRPENSAESTIFKTAATDATPKSRMDFRSTTMGLSSADFSSSSTKAYDQMGTSVNSKNSVAHSDSSIINSSTENNLKSATNSVTKKLSGEKASTSLFSSTDVQNEKSTTVISTNSVGYSGNSVYSSTKELESTDKSAISLKETSTLASITTALLDSTSKISSTSGLNLNNTTQATTNDLPMTSLSDYFTSLIKGSTLNVLSSTTQSSVSEGMSSSEKITSDKFLSTEKALEPSTPRTLSTENTSRVASSTDTLKTTSDAVISSKASTTEQFPTALSESTVSSEGIITQSSDMSSSSSTEDDIIQEIVDAAITAVKNVLNVTQPHEIDPTSSLSSTPSVQSSSRVTSVEESRTTVQMESAASELTAKSNGFDGSSSSAAILASSAMAGNDSVSTPMPVVKKSTLNTATPSSVPGSSRMVDKPMM